MNCDVNIFAFVLNTQFFFQARVAELESEITKLEGARTEMKTALSKAEHDHQRIYQELSKVT